MSGSISTWLPGEGELAAKNQKARAPKLSNVVVAKCYDVLSSQVPKFHRRLLDTEDAPKVVFGGKAMSTRRVYPFWDRPEADRAPDVPLELVAIH